LQRSQLGAAKAAFTQADKALPGQKPVADGLAEIARREDTYRRSKAAMDQHITARDYDGARRDAADARAAHPELYAADAIDQTLANMQRATVSASPATASAGSAAAGIEGRKRDAARQLQTAA